MTADPADRPCVQPTRDPMWSLVRPDPRTRRASLGQLLRATGFYLTLAAGAVVVVAVVLYAAVRGAA